MRRLCSQRVLTSLRYSDAVMEKTASQLSQLYQLPPFSSKWLRPLQTKLLTARINRDPTRSHEE